MTFGPSENPYDEDRSAIDHLAGYAPPTAADSVWIADLAEESSAQSFKLPHPHLGWAVLWMIVFWVVQIGVSVAVALVAIGIAVANGQTSQSQMEQAMASISVIMIPIGTLASVITSIVIAFGFYRREFGRKLALCGMAWHHWIVVTLLVLPLAVIASEITNCAGEVLPQFNAEVLSDFAAAPWPVVFISACLFPAIGEEIFCRGFLGRGLVAHHGAIAGVIFASLLFGIMHIDPVQSVGAAVLGLGLHYIYLTTRSLLAPMLVHMLNNTFAFWVMRNYEWCPLPGLSPLPSGEQVHTPVTVLIAAVAATAALLTLLYQSRTSWLVNSANSQSPQQEAWSPGYITAESPPNGIDSQRTTRWPNLGLAAIVVVTYSLLIGALMLSSQAALVR